jgi:hypothetical protein
MVLPPFFAMPTVPCRARTLKPGDLPEERDANWRGSMVGQNGKSATLTAPNGIAQEETALRGREDRPTAQLWANHVQATVIFMGLFHDI